MRLQQAGGAHGIDMVTPELVVPQVVPSILAAEEVDSCVPIAYDAGSFDSLTCN